jgi:DNA helicase-2/ATP-dependent DNA helicase PcrA
VAELMDAILQDAGYVDALRDGTDEGEDRFANLQELRGVAAQYVPGLPGLQPGQSALSLFLEEVSLVSDADDLEDNGGAVTLLTLHMAKGLEYPVVFMVGMEDGILPHSRSLESGDPEEMDEERRLCYVGVTRAKRRLYLIHAFRRSLWGGSELQTPSRFLDEVPAELLTGVVDKRARRAASYTRATSWENPSAERSPPARPNAAGGERYDWSRRREGGAQPDPKATYWSPGSGSASKPASAPARRATPPAAADGRQPQYKRRDSVQHERFGVGTVIESQLTRDDEEITVAFPGVGIKKLLASLAGLKKL